MEQVLLRAERGAGARPVLGPAAAEIARQGACPRRLAVQGGRAQGPAAMGEGMSKRLKLQLGGEADMEERAFANPYPDYQPHGAAAAAAPASSAADTQRDPAPCPKEEESLPFDADGQVGPGPRGGGAGPRPGAGCCCSGGRVALEPWGPSRSRTRCGGGGVWNVEGGPRVLERAAGRPGTLCGPLQFCTLGRGLERWGGALVF